MSLGLPRSLGLGPSPSASSQRASAPAPWLSSTTFPVMEERMTRLQLPALSCQPFLKMGLTLAFSCSLRLGLRGQGDREAGSPTTILLPLVLWQSMIPRKINPIQGTGMQPSSETVPKINWIRFIFCIPITKRDTISLQSSSSWVNVASSS